MLSVIPLPPTPEQNRRNTIMDGIQQPRWIALEIKARSTQEVLRLVDLRHTLRIKRLSSYLHSLFPKRWVDTDIGTSFLHLYTFLHSCTD